MKITAKHICALSDQKYSIPHKHMVAFEVANGTGGAADRRADAVAMEYWPSNGLEITGYEIKVSRSDWLNELKQPEKAYAISQYCDRWYVIAPKGVIKDAELPEGWGFIQASEKMLRTVVKSAKNKDAKIDKLFMASLMRKTLEKYQDTSLVDQIAKKYQDEANKEVERRVKYQVKRDKERYEKIKEALDGFEKKSGIRVNEYNYEKIGEVVKYLMDNKYMIKNDIHRIDSLINQKTRDLEFLRESKKELEGFQVEEVSEAEA
jgi:hypothetical protein